MVLIDILEESRKNKKLSTGILLKNIFADNWSKIFLFDGITDKSFSYKEFFTLVIKYSEKLQKLGISTRPATHAVHMLTFYREKYRLRPEDYPNAYAANDCSISLPLFHGMTDDQQERVVQAAEAAYQAAEARLRAGTIDTTTLLDAQRTLFNARDSLANARLDYLQTIVALYRVLGGGWSVQES